MSALAANNVTLNRKVLADLAVNEPQSFEAIVKTIS
jgi:large subunit ribosomal protein L20